MQGKLGDGVIVIGTATRDAECKRVGEKDTLLCSFSLAAGKKPDTTTIFVNVKAWRNAAMVARKIIKGDTVMVAGKVETREYNNKTYSDLNAEWVQIMRDTDEQQAHVAAPSQVQTQFGTMQESDQGDDLPF